MERIHFTSACRSASGTVGFGGIGTWPQTPVPPFFTFSASFDSMPFCPAYFFATSAYVGPTVFAPLGTLNVARTVFTSPGWSALLLNPSTRMSGVISPVL